MTDTPEEINLINAASNGETMPLEGVDEEGRAVYGAPAMGYLHIPLEGTDPEGGEQLDPRSTP